MTARLSAVRAQADAAKPKIERPAIVTDEHLAYLDDLRESGETNMFGARPYLMDEFGLSRQDAAEILSYWMRSFSERQS